MLERQGVAGGGGGGGNGGRIGGGTAIILLLKQINISKVSVGCSIMKCNHF